MHPPPPRHLRRLREVAPKSGKDTREFLKTKADYTGEEARTLAAHAKAFAIEEARKVKAATVAAKHEAEGLRS